MYNPETQQIPLLQLPPNKLAHYSPTSHKLSLTSLTSSTIVDEKQARLYLHVMEALAGDRERDQGEVVMGRDEGEGGWGLSGGDGVRKCGEAIDAVVRYCDGEGKTKDVHKVLYIVFRYLQFRIKSKSQPTYNIQALLSILNDASSIFHQDLQHPPISTPTPEPKQPTPSPIKQKSRNLQHLLSNTNPQHNQQHNPPLLLLPNKSRTQLQKQNPYTFLIRHLERYQLENLVTSLEGLIGVVVGEFCGEGEIGGLRGELIGRMEAVIGLVLRRVYTGQCLAQNYNLISQIPTFLHTNKHYLTINTMHNPNPQQNPLPPNTPNTLPAALQQKYNKLTLALKYVVSILLGNVTVMEVYAGFDVYCYLGLVAMYGEDGDGDGEEKGERGRRRQEGYGGGGVFHVQDCYYKARAYISKKLSLNSPPELTPTHTYILQLLSLPLPSSSPNLSPSPLAYHSFFQHTISYFTGYSFYAYTIISLMFGCGLVNKELYCLDEEYEGNAVGELLMAALGEIREEKKVEVLVEEDGDGERDGGRREQGWNQDSEDEFLGHRPYRLPHVDHILHYDSSKHDESRNSSKQGKLNKPSLSEPSPKPIPLPVQSSKLLLATISFYKNSLHKPKLLFEQHLKSKIDECKWTKTDGHSYCPTNAPTRARIVELQKKINWEILPLYQLIENLISGHFLYEKIVRYEVIDWLNVMAKYACRFKVEEYLASYLRNLIEINVGPVGTKESLIDKYTLELMTIELKIYIMSAEEIYSLPLESQPHELPHYNSYTSKFFLLSDYLTTCTLSEPFRYELLDKVRELTGIQSELKKLSYFVAKEFSGFFQIYFQLEPITKRGKYELDGQYSADLEEKKGEGKIEMMQRNARVKRANVLRLRDMSERLDKLITLICHNNLQGCGEILRVSWQILEDYQRVKTQTLKQVSHILEEEELLDKMADKVVIVVQELRHYIEMMEHGHYITEELVKFRQMIL